MLELFLDFDNTITQGDVLDRVIERYSKDESWREWEAEWEAGRMSTVECLSRQVAALRASPEELERFVSGTPIDPHFARIHAWAARRGARLTILSDNFVPLIGAILRREGLESTPVFANELRFEDGKLEPRFPWRDASCARCAHCKGVRVRAAIAGHRVFVGDGLSDVCGALAADVVFAKDSLAADLERRGVAFRRYASLAEVLAYLEAQEHQRLTHPEGAAR